jgi:hypothetical protein
MLKPVLKILFSFLGAFFLFLVSVSFVLAAPRLYFNSTTETVTKDSQFEILVKIDVESQSAFGSDAIIIFPGSDIEITNITNGGFFSDFSRAYTSGRLEIHGYFANSYDSKSGSGNFATITFKTKTDSGAGIISFACSESQILNTSGTNILNCASANQVTLTFTATPGAGEPNSCGGTCGSNYNCKAEFFCYSGFCRNPFCKTQVNCICPTATPTPKKTTTPRPLASATPQIIVLTEYATPSATPMATATPVPGEIGESQTSEGQGINWLTVAKLSGIAFLIILIIKVLKKLFGRKTPPTPPMPPTPPSQNF